MPPILLKQFHITYARAPSPPGSAPGVMVETNGDLQPIAVERYAICSDIVAVTPDEVAEGKVRLSNQDWRSGENKRVVRKIKPFGAIKHGSGE